MSDDQLKAFIAKIKADPNLRKMLDEDNADPIEIAKSFGFSISSATHYHLAPKRPDPAIQFDDDAFSELSDEDVEGISGGAGGGNVCKCKSRAFV